MADIVVVGAGFAGLTTALLLADDGHHVTLVERDGDEIPADPFASWPRRGVPQIRQPHVLLGRGWEALSENLPAAAQALLDSGCAAVNAIDHPPPFVTDISRSDRDERLVALRGRRTTFEPALRRLVDAAPRIEVRAGSGVAGLAHRAEAERPRVTGVVTEDGETVPADVGVVASGRRTPLAAWLAEIGASPYAEEAEPCHQIYLMRWYRLPAEVVGQLPTLLRGDVGWAGLFGFPGDDGWIALGVGPDSSDDDARRLRSPELFDRFAEQVPMWTRLIDQSTERTDPVFMGSLNSHHRRFAFSGEPVATGLVPLGDSRICTNPMYGRGMSLALLHALALRDALAEARPDDVPAAVEARAEAETALWYHDSVAADRAAHALRSDVIGGSDLDALNHPATSEATSRFMAAGADAEVFRRNVEVNFLFEPPPHLAEDPYVLAKAREVVESGFRMPQVGPSRKELIDIVAT
jgi:2-polyprenyl-6-methoxyphenol hydroxylase-like FAD-dependent oxidoreductase